MMELTTTSVVSFPFSAMLRSWPLVIPMDLVIISASIGAFSIILLNSSPRSTPEARPWVSCVMAPAASVADAPLTTRPLFTVDAN